MSRLKGSNIHGFQNEQNIVDAINGYSKLGSMFTTLNTNLKMFISSISNDLGIKLNKNSIIRAKKEKNNNLKTDIYIYIKDVKVSISCKVGSGNSIHQEKIENFCTYIKNHLDASDEICNDFRLLIWADGTLDGSGSMEKDENGIIKSRFTSSEFRKIYPENRKRLLNFVKKHERTLLNRFMFEDTSEISVDYVYHGNELNGVWLTKEEILDYNVANSKLIGENPRANLPCGRTTIQAWNISKKGNCENKRGEVQVKYSTIKKDFRIMMEQKAKNLGTFYGDIEEFGLINSMNSNKKLKAWSVLLPSCSDLSNAYLVKVNSNQISKLTNKKVKTKADAYAIRAELSQNFLLDKNFIITEDDLQYIEHDKIDYTGISIKRFKSKHFTYQKFGLNSFTEAFDGYIDSPEYFFLGVLLYIGEKDSVKNESIMEDFGIRKIDLIDFFTKVSNKNIFEIEDSQKAKFIKTFSSSYIKHVIDNNSKLSDLIFKGKYNFEEPYVAYYIYIDGILKENVPDDFYITTGSGRSKGVYTIIVKPKT